MIIMVELFSGTGCQTQALKNIGVQHETYTCEWQVNSIITYDAIHTNDGNDYTKEMSKNEVLDELSKFTFSTDGKNPCNLSRMNEKKLRLLYNANKRSKNLGDISKVEKLPKCDIIFHSSPCQTFSISGKNEGGNKDSGTSSSLMWESVRLIKEAKPKITIWENVKNVLSKKHRHNFEDYLSEMDEIGYNNYYEVLNAKDYGIPQNRERIFCVSIRKDLNNGFEFPIGVTDGNIITYTLQKQVRKRKNKCNLDELKSLLKQSKVNSNLSIKNISDELKEKKTLVEHWFRNDNCFSIPDEVSWFKLKKNIRY